MTQQKTSKGALARREPLGIASIFPTDSNLEHIEYHGKIKIFRWRFGVSEPTASLFIELSGFDSPGDLSPRMLFGARFDASGLGIAFRRAIRWQLAPIVRFALDNHEARPPIRAAFREAWRCWSATNSSLSKLGGFRPGVTQIPVTGGGHE